MRVLLSGILVVLFLAGCGGGGGGGATQTVPVVTAVDGTWKLPDTSRNTLHFLPTVIFDRGTVVTIEYPVQIIGNPLLTQDQIIANNTPRLTWTGTFSVSGNSLTTSYTNFNGNVQATPDVATYTFVVTGNTLTLTDHTVSPPISVSYTKQ
jgi:hypothetical protein